MKTTLLLIISLFMFVSVQDVIAQNVKEKKSDIQMRMEAVKEQCKNIPLDKRIRVTVARFSSTAGNSPRELGENMSTMLSNALSQVNCFNVLEEQKNMSDMTAEIDASNSEYSDAATGIEKGKMKLAQIIVTGEVTEYSEAANGLKVMGIGGTVSAVKIGFILKIINPRTREILKSSSFNVESKKGSSFRISIFSHKSSTNPAVADALEQGIIQATEYLAAQKEYIPIPSEAELSSNLTMVTVANMTFSQKSNTLELLKSTVGVKQVELSSFSNNTAVYSVRHNNSTDELATVIDRKYMGRFEITGTQSGKIIMRAK